MIIYVGYINLGLTLKNNFLIIFSPIVQLMPSTIDFSLSRLLCFNIIIPSIHLDATYVNFHRQMKTIKALYVSPR